MAVILSLPLFISSLALNTVPPASSFVLPTWHADASLRTSYQWAAQQQRHGRRRSTPCTTSLLAASDKNGRDGIATQKSEKMSDVDEYRNGVTAFLSNFMQSSPSVASSSSADAAADLITNDPLSDIDFNAPKAPKMSLEDLADTLDAELYEKEWFVTGRVNPVYFDEKFQFQDPDVKLTGVEGSHRFWASLSFWTFSLGRWWVTNFSSILIPLLYLRHEEYARGVVKLFDQSTSRAQIISTVVNTTVPNTITCTWRLSGRVNIGPNGLPIKPYICYTDFTIDEKSGLVVFQEDRFDVPGWDILLSALFPFLIGKVTKEAAPEVEPRVVIRRQVGVMGGMKKGIGEILGVSFRKLGLWVGFFIKLRTKLK